MESNNTTYYQKSGNKSVPQSTGVARSTLMTPNSKTNVATVPGAPMKGRQKSPLKERSDDDLERLVYSSNTPQEGKSLLERVKSARSRTASSDNEEPVQEPVVQKSEKPLSLAERVSMARSRSQNQDSSKSSLKTSSELSSGSDISSPLIKGTPIEQSRRTLSPPRSLSNVQKSVPVEQEEPRKMTLAERVNSARNRSLESRDSPMSQMMDSQRTQKSLTEEQSMETVQPKSKSPNTLSFQDRVALAREKSRSRSPTVVRDDEESQVVEPKRSASDSTKSPSDVSKSPSGKTMEQRIMEAKLRAESKSQMDKTSLLKSSRDRSSSEGSTDSGRKSKSLTEQLADLRKNNELKSSMTEQTSKVSGSKSLGANLSGTTSLLESLSKTQATVEPAVKSQRVKSAPLASNDDPFASPTRREGIASRPTKQADVVLSKSLDTSVSTEPKVIRRSMSPLAPDEDSEMRLKTSSYQEKAKSVPVTHTVAGHEIVSGHRSKTPRGKSVTENTRRTPADSFLEEAATLRSLRLTVLDYYPIAGENKCLILAKTPYRNKVMVVVNLKEGKLLFNSNGKTLKESEPHPVLEKVLDEGVFDTASPIGLYFEIFERAVIAFNEDGKIKTSYFDVHATSVEPPYEAHPYPVIKYELLTQPLEVTTQLLTQIEDASHMMMFKHMMKVFAKNETVWGMFEEGINKAVSFANKLKNMEDYFKKISQVERALIESKYSNVIVPLINGITSDKSNAVIADEKEKVQDQFYHMLGQMRQLNRIKVIALTLKKEIEQLTTLSVNNAIVAELEKFANLSGEDLSIFVSEGQNL